MRRECPDGKAVIRSPTFVKCWDLPVWEKQAAKAANGRVFATAQIVKWVHSLVKMQKVATNETCPFAFHGGEIRLTTLVDFSRAATTVPKELAFTTRNHPRF
jgi:hypothetical protein